MSYNVVSGSVQVPSDWLYLGDSSNRVTFQSLINSSLSENSNHESWLSTSPYRVEEAPTTYSGYPKKFTVVDASLAGTNYTASTSGVHDDINISDSYNVASNAASGTWLDNSHFVLGNQWLITAAGQINGYGRMTITRFDPNDALRALVHTVSISLGSGTADVVTGSPDMGTTTLTQDSSLAAVAVTGSAPSIGIPIITQD